ncbi:ATP-binding cassette domain-containing protein [Streptomyces sp. NPDC041068]|uniref:ATP-binding cassette domain-containing protein n=1 Tax=Streptomyces sp. NPDC041068 TaxID=3155130 RepID=UPI0033E4C56E
MITARGLTVRHRRRTAVDGIDLRLPAGVHGLLGPNGAGKTSLIRVLATAAEPSAGRLTLLGEDPSHYAGLLAVRRRLGYLPQEFGVYRHFTTREFLGYAAWLKDVPARDVAAAVEHAAHRVGLADHLDTKLRALSGGMKQRVGIAQAIVNEPDLLLLDEPTTGLDPAQRERLHALLRAIGESATVVVSTHLMEDITGACDDVLVLADGRIRFHGTVETLTALGGYAAVLP